LLDFYSRYREGKKRHEGATVPVIFLLDGHVKTHTLRRARREVQHPEHNL